MQILSRNEKSWNAAGVKTTQVFFVEVVTVEVVTFLYSLLQKYTMHSCF